MNMKSKLVWLFDWQTISARCGAKTPKQLALGFADGGLHIHHFKFQYRPRLSFAYQMFAALDKWGPASLAEDVKWISLNHDRQPGLLQQEGSLLDAAPQMTQLILETDVQLIQHKPTHAFTHTHRETYCSTEFTPGSNCRVWAPRTERAFSAGFPHLSRRFVLSHQHMPHTYSTYNQEIIPPLSISMCSSLWGLSTLGWGHAGAFPRGRRFELMAATALLRWDGSSVSLGILAFPAPPLHREVGGSR